METKKSKKLRIASRLIGYIGVAICLLLIGLQVYGLVWNEGSLQVPVPFTDKALLFGFEWLWVYVTAAVAAVIILIAAILRAASAKAKKAAPVAATKGGKVRAAVASAKEKVQNIQINDETKEKVTTFVKKNAPVIIAVLATFTVTATVDRIIMAKKLRRIRRR
ncbi:MAG: hypothetical protein E7620_07735 [Ruminococcaceae bacterium]|nr:hypothetical protein [Oscillospiraceae bacterium]